MKTYKGVVVLFSFLFFIQNFGMEKVTEELLVRDDTFEADEVIPHYCEDIIVYECFTHGKSPLDRMKRFIVVSAVKKDEIIYQATGVDGLVSPNCSMFIVEFEGKDSARGLMVYDVRAQSHTVFEPHLFKSKELRYWLSDTNKSLIVECNGQCIIFDIQTKKEIYRDKVLFSKAKKYIFFEDTHVLLVEGAREPWFFMGPEILAPKIIKVVNVINKRVIFDSDPIRKEHGNRRLYSYFLRDNNETLFVEYEHRYSPKECRVEKEQNILVIVDLSAQGEIVYRSEGFSRLHSIENSRKIVFERIELPHLQKMIDWVTIVDLDKPGKQEEKVIFEGSCDTFKQMQERKRFMLINKDDEGKKEGKPVWSTVRLYGDGLQHSVQKRRVDILDVDFVTPHCFDDKLIYECCIRGEFGFSNKYKKFVVMHMADRDNLIFEATGKDGKMSPDCSKFVVEFAHKNNKKSLLVYDLASEVYVTFEKELFDSKVLQYWFSDNGKALIVQWYQQFAIFDIASKEKVYQDRVQFDEVNRYRLRGDGLLTIEGKGTRGQQKVRREKLKVVDINKSKVLYDSEVFEREQSNRRLYRWYFGKNGEKLFVEYGYYCERSFFDSHTKASALVIIDLETGDVLYNTNDFKKYHLVENTKKIIFENTTFRNYSKQKKVITIADLTKKVKQEEKIIYKKICDSFQFNKEKMKVMLIDDYVDNTEGESGKKAYKKIKIYDVRKLV